MLVFYNLLVKIVAQKNIRLKKPFKNTCNKL